MVDAQKGAEKKDEGKQPVEMPATEKPTEVSAPLKEEARPAESGGELPAEVKERTREEFEKLKAKNKELAEKLTQYEGPTQKRPSGLDIFAPRGEMVAEQSQVQPQKAVPKVDEIQPISPDENGYVDISSLNQTIAQINERNRKAEEQARLAAEKARLAEDRVSKYEHTEQTLKTYEKHPYLDPNTDAFDERFSELTKLEIIRQMTEEGTANYLKAANKVKEAYYDPTKKPKAEPDKEQQQNVAKKEQINAIPGVETGGKETDQDYLVSESRRGNRDALYQRLKKSGF